MNLIDWNIHINKTDKSINIRCNCVKMDTSLTFHPFSTHAHSLIYLIDSTVFTDIGTHISCFLLLIYLQPYPNKRSYTVISSTWFLVVTVCQFSINKSHVSIAWKKIFYSYMWFNTKKVKIKGNWTCTCDNVSKVPFFVLKIVSKSP